MSVKQGNAVLRVSLSRSLIRHLKKVAIDEGVDPCVLVEAALKQHLPPEPGTAIEGAEVPRTPLHNGQLPHYLEKV